MAEWGRHDGDPLVRALGFTHRSPCAATLHTVFRCVEREAVAAKLRAWAEGLLGEASPPEGGVDAIAIAGKTLRGSQKQGAPGVHLLSAFAHRLGVTLTTGAVKLRRFRTEIYGTERRALTGFFFGLRRTAG